MPRQVTEQEVQRLLEAQRNYFAQGHTRPYAFRAAQLRGLRQAILDHQAQLERALRADLGKSAFESYATEIGFLLASIRHAMRHLKKWMKPRREKTPFYLLPAQSRVIRQPYGCVYIIGPYNYPFQLLMEPLVGAIAAGNCAVLSPSELAPHVAEVTMDILAEAFPRDYVACVDGGVENNTLLLHAGFDKIFFTGSVGVGRIVMEAAARQLIPVTLELGGKSPVIVDKTANLPLACQRILWGKLMNAGQTCVAPDYVFVAEERKMEFLEGLKQTIRAFYGEDPKVSPDYGRIINERHIRRLSAILERDRDDLYWGGAVDPEQRYLEPTILCPSTMEAACMQEELFGPILPVIGYTDLGQVLSYINRNPKPLALYLFSEDRAWIDRIIHRTASGGVSVNDTISHLINPNLPFGGVGTSGMGNYHGVHSFDAFSHARSIYRKTTRLRMGLVFPPFSDQKLKQVKLALK